MPKQYDAFVSYKHGTIAPLSKVLASGLRTFARPLFARPRNVFRDEEHLVPGSSLPSVIQKALERSRFLVLLASPEAARSPWVEREIRVWCEELGRTDRLIIVLVEGSLETDPSGSLIDWRKTDSLPAVLEARLNEVPFFVDLRALTASRGADQNHPAVKAAIAGIVARLENVDLQDLIGLEVVQRRRRIRLRNSAIALLSVLAVTSAVAAFYANGQRLAQQKATFAALANALSAQVRPDTTSAFDERNALVARQAYLFAQRSDRPPSDAVHRALRTALEPEHFTTALAVTAGFVSHVAADRDGHLIAAATDSGRVQIWRNDLPQRSMIWQLEGRPEINAFAVDTGGRWLAAGAKGDGVIRLWNLSAPDLGEAQPQMLTGHTLAINDLAFDAEGQRLASASADGTVRVWTLRHRDETPQILRHLAEVATVSFAGTRIMSRTIDRETHVWTSDGTSVLPNHAWSQRGRLGVLEISPSGRWLLDVDFASKDLRLQDLGRNDEITQLTSPAGEITAAAFSPSEQRLAVGTSDGDIVVWTLTGSDAPVRITSGHATGVTDLAFFGSDALVSSGQQDGFVRIRHLSGAAKSSTLVSGFSSARFAGDDDHLIGIDRGTRAPALRSLTPGVESAALATGQGADAAKEWYLARTHAVSVDFERKKGSAWPASASSGQPVQFAFANYPSDKPLQVVVGEDGRVLAWVDRYDLSVWVQDLTRTDIAARKMPDQPIRPTIQAALAPDGSQTHVLSVGVRDWSAPLAVSADDSRLAMGASDGSVRVWRLDQPAAAPFVLTGLGGWPLSLAFSADGGLLAVGTSQRTIRVWDFRARRLRTLRGHDGRVDALSFAPDRPLLASAGAEGTVRLWDLAFDEPQAIVLEGAGVTALSFSSSGQRLAGAGSDSARVWTVAASALAERVCDVVSRNLSLDEWRDLVGRDIPYDRTCTDVAVHASLLDTARALARTGALADAEAIVREARRADPEHTGDWDVAVNRAVAEGQMADAEERARSGDVDAAVRLMTEAVKRGAALTAPPDVHAKQLAADGLLAQAGRLTRQADLPLAISLLDRAIALAPTAAAFEARGTALAVQGDFQKARLDFDRAIQLEPARWELYARRGETFASEKQWDTAYEDFSRALRLIHEARNGLGQIDVRKLGVADSVTRTLLVLGSSSFEILMRRADVSVKLKDFTGALADYGRLVQEYPRSAEVVYRRGLAYMESGRCDSAMADFGTSLTLDPKNWRAYVGRALCLRERGLAQKGRADLMAAKALEPANTVIADVIKTYPAR